jgi:hypothetical protein
VPRRPDPALIRKVTDLLRHEAARDPRGSVTASYVKDSLDVSATDAILALDALERSGFLTLVYHDICERGHVNHDVIDEPARDRGTGFCAPCARDMEHVRYVLYRFTEALRGRDGDPKAPRRRAPQYRNRREAVATTR